MKANTDKMLDALINEAVEVIGHATDVDRDELMGALRSLSDGEINESLQLAVEDLARRVGVEYPS